MPDLATRLTAQQRALLRALAEQSPVPTTILYDVTVRRGDMFPGISRPDITYRIGEPAGAALRRLEKRGLVTAERCGKQNDWWISDAGLEAIGALTDAE